MNTIDQRHTPKRRSSNRLSRSGFSMVELIVVMGIIAVLAAMLMPAIGQAWQAAMRTQCMNNLRNVSFGLTQFDHFHNRLPASGYYYDPPSGAGGSHHSWAVSILPFIEQVNVYNKWQLNKPISDPANEPLARSYVPIYFCPIDISRSKKREGDLSYVVNGPSGLRSRPAPESETVQCLH